MISFATLDVSIHAAREGGDHRHPVNQPHDAVSIHAAREGGDAPMTLFLRMTTSFQSTPPARAATSYMR